MSAALCLSCDIPDTISGVIVYESDFHSEFAHVLLNDGIDLSRSYRPVAGAEIIVTRELDNNNRLYERFYNADLKEALAVSRKHIQNLDYNSIDFESTSAIYPKARTITNDRGCFVVDFGFGPQSRGLHLFRVNDRQNPPFYGAFFRNESHPMVILLLPDAQSGSGNQNTNEDRSLEYFKERCPKW